MKELLGDTSKFEPLEIQPDKYFSGQNKKHS